METNTPTIVDRLGAAAVTLLLAAFLLASMSVFVTQASADSELNGKRDDDTVEIATQDDDDDDDDSGNTGNSANTGNSGNGGDGTRDTGTGTTKGTGQSNNSNTRDSGKGGGGDDTGTTKGTGPSNSNTRDSGKGGTNTASSN